MEIDKPSAVDTTTAMDVVEIHLPGWRTLGQVGLSEPFSLLTWEAVTGTGLSLTQPKATSLQLVLGTSVSVQMLQWS